MKPTRPTNSPVPPIPKRAVAVSKRRLLALQQVNERLGELSKQEQATRASMERGPGD